MVKNERQIDTLRLKQAYYRYGQNHGGLLPRLKVAKFVFPDAPSDMAALARLRKLESDTKMRETIRRVCAVYECDANYLFGIERGY